MANMYNEIIANAIRVGDILADLNELAKKDGFGAGVAIAKEAIRVELSTQILILDRLVHMMPQEKAKRWAAVRVYLFAVMFK